MVLLDVLARELEKLFVVAPLKSVAAWTIDGTHLCLPSVDRQ
jgi:hypothetical protein